MATDKAQVLVPRDRDANEESHRLQLAKCCQQLARKVNSGEVILYDSNGNPWQLTVTTGGVLGTTAL